MKVISTLHDPEGRLLPVAAGVGDGDGGASHTVFLVIHNDDTSCSGGGSSIVIRGRSNSDGWRDGLFRVIAENPSESIAWSCFSARPAAPTG